MDTQINIRTRFAIINRVKAACDDNRPTTKNLMQMIKTRDLPWPVSRITANRVDAVLQSLGCFCDDEGKWLPEPPAPPTVEEKIQDFAKELQSLQEDYINCSCYGFDCTCRKAAYDFENALETFQRSFSEFFPQKGE